MKYLLPAATLILLAVGFLFWQQPKPYINSEVGFQTTFPSGTTVKVNAVTASSTMVTFTSTDYAEKEVQVSADLGGYSSTTAVIQGFKITVLSAPAQGYNEKIMNPAAFAQFYADIGKDCSNCIETKIITLGGQPAVFERIYDTYADGTSELLMVDTMHNHRLFAIHYTYDAYTPERQKSIEQFIKNFKFTN